MVPGAVVAPSSQREAPSIPKVGDEAFLCGIHAPCSNGVAGMMIRSDDQSDLRGNMDRQMRAGLQADVRTGGVPREVWGRGVQEGA